MEFHIRYRQLKHHTHDDGHSHEHKPESEHAGGHTHEHSHEHEHRHTHEGGETHSHLHAHTHSHQHEHDHEHSHEHRLPEQAFAKDEEAALLRYMCEHNRHHAQELRELAEKLSASGKAEAAAFLTKAVSAFEQGSAELEAALKAM